MATNISDRLDNLHPQMLRAPSPSDPQRLGMESRRAIGQCFEWALDRARMENKQAAALMGYTDQGVVSRWISGAERVQLDKVKLCLPQVYSELLVALLQGCEGVEVKTQVTLARVG